MKIRFTKNTYASKKKTIDSLGSAEWLEADGDFNTLVYLYQSGHVVHISDTANSCALILDLDDLTDAQAECIHHDSYLLWVQTAMQAKRIVRFDSSSRKYYKQKLLIEIDYKRDIVRNKDKAYIALRKQFEELTTIKCDPKMDSYTQVTFGIKLNDPQYEIAFDLASAVPSTQPSCSKKHPQIYLPEDGKGNRKELGRFIPLSPAGYNKHYGKQFRPEGRFDWTITHYVGFRQTEKTRIRAGNRHNVLGKLIKCATYNALNQNQNYSTDFNANDVASTALCIVGIQFEHAKTFLAEECQSIMAQSYKEFERGSSMGLDEYYRLVCEESGCKVHYGYKPRSVSMRALLRQALEERVPQDENELKAMLGDIAQGDLGSMRALKLYYKSLVHKPLAKGRPKADYGQYIKQCAKNSKGKVLVDSRYYRSSPFRTYCKKQGIPIALKS